MTNKERDEKIEATAATCQRIEISLAKIRTQVMVLWTGASIGVSIGVTLLVNWMVS
jgi:hypothetical protein